jgi:Zn-dependent protease with chaperone function
MRVLLVFLVNAIAPVLALGVALYGLRPDIVGGDVAEAAIGASRCAIDSVLRREMDCAAPLAFGWLGAGAVATLVLVILVLVVNRLAAWFLGTHRELLAIGFTPYAFANIPAILGVGLANMALVGGSAYLAAHHWFNADASILLGVLAVSALGLFWVMLSQGLAFFRTPKTFAAARPISLHEQPRLGLLIRDVAKRTESRMPDNVILGLEPTFYATNAPVQTPYMKGPLKGQTLHLSLPLLAMFSTEELKAVIGHELGHFSGKDTAYSMRFAPALAGMHGAVQRVRNHAQTITGIFLAPAQKLLEDFVEVFGAVHGRISRSRESRADRLGAEAASPQDVAYSLLKASVGGSVWRGTIDGLIARARMGRFSRNIVRSFVDQVRFDLDREKLPPSLEFALGVSLAHPTDAHPPTETRIGDLGLSLKTVLEDERVLAKFFTGERANDSLDNLTPIEEDLTTLYYHILSEQWAPMAPEKKDAEEIFLCLMADFLARMATIDGSVDDREIEAAEAAAARVFDNFDRDGFRERCRNPDDLPDLDRMVQLANMLLTETGAENLKASLRKVAEADKRVTEEEEALLRRIETDLRPNADSDEA